MTESAAEINHVPRTWASRGIKLIAFSIAAWVLYYGYTSTVKQDSTLPPQTDEVEPAPMLVLIVVDTLRMDQVSSFAGEGVRTPNIDRIGTLGTRFTAASSVASWTAPSMGAMLTSLYPAQLGMVESRTKDDRIPADRALREQKSWSLPQEADTMAERLRRAGFRTGAFVDQPALVNSDFRQGFDVWFSADTSHRVLKRDSTSGPTDQTWEEGLGPETLRIDQELAARFDDWLGEQPESPTFAWIHLLTPHAPYVSKLPTDESPVGPPLNQYAAEVRAIDAVVGAVLDTIERRVGLHNSHIIFTSDHGEAFREHGIKDRDHGHSLRSNVTHVPLIVASPAMARGAVVNETVRSIDILPTVLELAEIPRTEDDGLEGLSLLDVGDGHSRNLYAEGMLYGPTERMFVSGGLVLYYDEGEAERRWQLFDLSGDPGQTHDVSKFRPEEMERMRQQFDAHRARLESTTIWQGAEGAEENNTLTPNTNEALRALGYIE